MPVNPIPKQVQEQLKIVKSHGAAGAIEFVWLSDVEPEPIDWLWYPYIPRRKLTLFTGAEGIGKSFITATLASIVSNGWRFPFAETETEAGRVLFLAQEDGTADTLKPRLMLANANHRNIAAITSPFAFDDLGLLRFQNLVAQIKPSLILLDPIFSYFKGGTNINLATEIRPVTTRLTTIAEEYNAAIVAVRHIGKSKGGGEGRAAGLGSIDLRAIARSEIIIGRDPDNPAEGALIHDKCNIAPLGKPVGYEITDRGLCWLGTTSLTAEKVLSPFKPENGGAKLAYVEAMNFLREVLADGARYAHEVRQHAKELGITEKTLRTARERLKIASYKRGGQYGGDDQYVWELPAR